MCRVIYQAAGDWIESVHRCMGTCYWRREKITSAKTDTCLSHFFFLLNALFVVLISLKALLKYLCSVCMSLLSGYSDGVACPVNLRHLQQRRVHRSHHHCERCLRRGRHIQHRQIQLPAPAEPRPARMYIIHCSRYTLLFHRWSHTFENPAFIWSWEAFVVTVVNTTAFFFREGVWHHGIFVSRRNVKECDTHVFRKSCIIKPIRRRLRNSWSVSTFVYHMHQH